MLGEAAHAVPRRAAAALARRGLGVRGAYRPMQPPALMAERYKQVAIKHT